MLAFAVATALTIGAHQIWHPSGLDAPVAQLTLAGRSLVVAIGVAAEVARCARTSPDLAMPTR